MDHVLKGFADELVKLSAAQSVVDREKEELRSLYRDVKKRSQRGPSSGIDKIRGKGRRVSRDYLASTLIGAVATPAAILLGSKFGRRLHNRQVRQAMSGLKGKRRKALARHLETGPSIGRGTPLQKGKKPLMTHSELAGNAVRGGVMGSVIQMLRDRFSGSAGAADRR